MGFSDDTWAACGVSDPEARNASFVAARQEEDARTPQEWFAILARYERAALVAADPAATISGINPSGRRFESAIHENTGWANTKKRLLADPTLRRLWEDAFGILAGV